MIDKNLHSDNDLGNEMFDDFLNKVEVDHNKTKEDVWKQLENNIYEKPTVNRRMLNRYAYSIAAALVILFSAFAFLKYYTLTVNTNKGQHLVFSLPDGSKVSLNAESTIKYHPYWWRFSRQIDFEGEAFFEVEKGKVFQVGSSAGKTFVLGTSFNIYSRDGDYNVDCITGKVKVVSPEKFEVILTPSYSASIQTNGKIYVSKFSSQMKSSEWINNMFSFTSVPLIEVLKEVERQFNIEIETNISSELIYTGHFSANRNIEETLDLLCKPFGLQFEKISIQKYRLN
mgnify:CR=1 FL=1